MSKFVFGFTNSPNEHYCHHSKDSYGRTQIAQLLEGHSAYYHHEKYHYSHEGCCREVLWKYKYYQRSSSEHDVFESSRMGTRGSLQLTENMGCGKHHRALGYLRRLEGNNTKELNPASCIILFRTYYIYQQQEHN